MNIWKIPSWEPLLYAVMPRFVPYPSFAYHMIIVGPICKKVRSLIQLWTFHLCLLEDMSSCFSHQHSCPAINVSFVLFVVFAGTSLTFPHQKYLPPIIRELPPTKALNQRWPGGHYTVYACLFLYELFICLWENNCISSLYPVCVCSAQLFSQQKGQQGFDLNSHSCSGNWWLFSGTSELFRIWLGCFPISNLCALFHES